MAPSRPDKLYVQRVGPGEVVRQLLETDYVVKFPERDKNQVFKVDMIVPYFQRGDSIKFLLDETHRDEEGDIPALKLYLDVSELFSIVQDIHLNSLWTLGRKRELDKQIERQTYHNPLVW